MPAMGAAMIHKPPRFIAGMARSYGGGNLESIGRRNYGLCKKPARASGFAQGAGFPAEPTLGCL